MNRRVLNVIPIEICFLPLFIITNITSGTLSASGALPEISAVMRTKGVRNLFLLGRTATFPQTQ